MTIDELSPRERRRAFVQATTLVIVPAATIILIAVAIGVGYALYRVEGVARDTNNILRHEVQEKDKTIADLTYILEQQAVPAATDLAVRVQTLTGEEIRLLFGPNHPPYKPKENP